MMPTPTAVRREQKQVPKQVQASARRRDDEKRWAWGSRNDCWHAWWRYLEQLAFTNGGERPQSLSVITACCYGLKARSAFSQPSRGTSRAVGWGDSRKLRPVWRINTRVGLQDVIGYLVMPVHCAGQCWMACHGVTGPLLASLVNHRGASWLPVLAAGASRAAARLL